MLLIFRIMQDKELFDNVKPSGFNIRSREAKYFDVSDIISASSYKIDPVDIDFFERLDLIYRTLCVILYNFVPTSGHPGGSISSGRIAEGLLFENMFYDLSDPLRDDNDLLVYSAGHKAMGLYALWAIRNELIKASEIPLLPRDERYQLRLEDLLGFRKNPKQDTPLFRKFRSKSLDGHPSPATPFVKVTTGASGFGVGSSVGLAIAAMDSYRINSPRINLIEGEGGLTPGRVGEALSSASVSKLNNFIMHIDYNQSSIDSDTVTSEQNKTGEYVPWYIDEFFYMHNFNTINVSDGHNFLQILSAQKFVNLLQTKQPTAIIYRTTKGWKYGIEGKSSHGSGHKFLSEGYYNALSEFEKKFNKKFRRYSDITVQPEFVEKAFYDALMLIREVIDEDEALKSKAAEKISNIKRKLDQLKRRKRSDMPDLSKAYGLNIETPTELRLFVGDRVTPKEVLGKALNYINKVTNGAIFVSSADLYSSTGVNIINKGFPEGFYNSVSNPDSRLVSAGGICEDAMGSIASGISSYSKHIGVSSSYSAFISPLEHISARLHSIGEQGKKDLTGNCYNPFIIINAHSSIKTGEDGPTHADPQSLQLLQSNFPDGMMITLTPLEPSEIWPLISYSLSLRPAVIAPFITRPKETIIDRKLLNIPDATESLKGLYYLMRADMSSKQYNGTFVILGNACGMTFVKDVMPEIKKSGFNMNVLYITSKELFDRLSPAEKEALYPEYLSFHSIGITDFTLPVLYYWVRSNYGLDSSLYPFKHKRYTGSGSFNYVMKEAGVDAYSQIKKIKEYALYIEKNKIMSVMPRGH